MTLNVKVWRLERLLDQGFVRCSESGPIIWVKIIYFHRMFSSKVKQRKET